MYVRVHVHAIRMLTITACVDVHGSTCLLLVMGLHTTQALADGMQSLTFLALYILNEKVLQYVIIYLLLI